MENLSDFINQSHAERNGDTWIVYVDGENKVGAISNCKGETTRLILNLIKHVEGTNVSVDELWDEYSELIDDDIDSLTRWAGSVVIDKEKFKKLMLKIGAAGSSNEEWDSQRMVGRVHDRFKELEAKGWEWRSFYNGWLEGRADMFAQVKGIGKYKDSGKEEAVVMNQRIAQQILKVRDAIIARDMDLAYHELYKIASPNFDKMSHEVWDDIEKAALQPTIEIDLAAAMEEGAELWKMEYDSCRRILEELVNLKDIKDMEGKTEDYLMRQSVAWVRAKRFLEKYQHINW